MTRLATQAWLAALRVTGWLLAPLPVVALGALLLSVYAEKRADAVAADRRWDQTVVRIRACRRARPGPMLDWRVCEELVGADSWRSRPAHDLSADR